MSENILTMDLQLFADVDLNTQTTLSNDLSPEMKTFYSKDLIEMAKAKLVHAQFAEHKPLPKNGGKEVEWRKWSSFKKALKPLEEGVTPKGSAIAVGAVTKKVEQFGDYSTVSDVLELTAIDNVIVEITSKHADNAGLTLDTIARNELITATQVIYAPVVTSSGVTEVNSRAGLTKDAKLTPELIAKAVTQLKKNNAPKINGDYVCIIHPSVAFDLMRHKEWIDAHQYTTSENIYSGELGKLYGVRFVESTEAAVLVGADLTSTSRSITASAISGATITVSGVTAEDAKLLPGREVLLYTGSAYEKATIASATTTSITLTETPAATTVTKLYPGEGGKETDDEKCAVYECIFLGKGAYGDVELEGGGMETIVKQKGSGGTADPLNQRSTIGWKCTGYGVKILIPEYIVKVECGSTFSGVDEAN